MKKKISIPVCLATLALCMVTPPALAAGKPYDPVSVEKYTYGSFDELRIEMVYHLSPADDPSGIPTEDFEQNGRLYYLLDITQREEVGVDTQNYTDTITQDSDTCDMAQILKRLDTNREVETEDGYSGLLKLDYISVTAENKDCKSGTQNLSDTRYTVTATYTGQVSKTDCDVTTYTVTFGSKDLDKSMEQERGLTQAVDSIISLSAMGLAGVAILFTAVWNAGQKRDTKS